MMFRPNLSAKRLTGMIMRRIRCHGDDVSAVLSVLSVTLSVSAVP